MLKMRYVVVLTFVLLACVAAKDDRVNEYRWGKMQPGDVVLYREILTKPGKKNKKSEEYLTVPPLLSTKNRVITEIQITDLSKNGYAFLHKGRVGERSATIHLKSAMSQGYRFMVKVYGH